jgi:hypothetical protein
MDEKSHTAEQMPPTIGRYQVQANIGYGAMGAVYKAFDPLIKRTLAIKTIRLDIPKSSPQYKSFLERFYHEARISGTLSHPNIVTLFDIGEEGGLPYLAMEYVEGETIASIVEKGTKFDPERVIGLVSQIAAAIDYAHSRGVIHRDIKPSNLILAEGDRVKVTDFGIAKLVDAEMTQSGALLGTPSYMSPEQAMGDKLDGRSDIFSLGICGFEMLSGEQPFPGTNVTSILYKLVHLPPVEPANLEMNGLVPQKWHEVFGRVLAKKADDRYQTASAFVQDLELCLGSWFGSAMGEDGAPATVMMSASGAAASVPADSSTTASIPPKAVAAAAAASARPPAPAAEPEPEKTAAMALPDLPKPAVVKTPPPAAATPAPGEEVATVLMKAPVIPGPPPAAPAASGGDVDVPTLQVRPATSAPAPAPTPPADNATRQMPVMAPPPPKAAAPAPKPKAEPAKPKPSPPAPKPAAAAAAATPAPASPHTEPVPRPPDLAAPAPPAKSGGGAGKLIAAGAVAFVLFVGMLVVVGIVAKRHWDARGQTTVSATPTVSTPEPRAMTLPPKAPSTVVHVVSEPAGAMIFVDGEAKGITPLDLSGVAMGPHEIRVELDGYEPKSDSVELTASAPEAGVNLTLATPAPVPVAPTTGTADITSTPSGAAVILDGKPAGSTPLRGLTLKPGTHRLELRADGHEPYAANLVVTAGKRARLAAVLRAEVKATAVPEPTKDTFDPSRVYDESDVDTKPKKISGPGSPTYPGNLKSGEKISVAVTWVVTENGENSEAKITTSAGKAVDDAVMQMLSKQKYEPGVKKGTKVKVRMTRIYTFRSG